MCRVYCTSIRCCASCAAFQHDRRERFLGLRPFYPSNKTLLVAESSLSGGPPVRIVSAICSQPCACCFRLRMNVVWDALPRCVPRCRAAALSRAFRAFRAAFRAAALSALLSALSVSRFVAPGPRLVTKRSAVLRFYPVSIVKWLDCSQVGLFSSTSPSWSTQGSPADQCLSSSVSSLHRGHANLLCIVPMHLLRVMLT